MLTNTVLAITSEGVPSGSTASPGITISEKSQFLTRSNTMLTNLSVSGIKPSFRSLKINRSGREGSKVTSSFVGSGEMLAQYSLTAARMLASSYSYFKSHFTPLWRAV